jgi:DNA primase large subunit
MYSTVKKGCFTHFDVERIPPCVQKIGHNQRVRTGGKDRHGRRFQLVAFLEI